VSNALTDAVLRSLKPPMSGRLEIADAASRGLRFRVTPNAEKSFSFRFREPTTGRWERVPIGRYPDVSLRDARARADELRREVAAGRNPAEHRRSAGARTFAKLADRYLVEHARRFKRSADADERMLRKHVLPLWARRDHTMLGRGDLIELVEGIITDGKPIAANRVQALVSGWATVATEPAIVVMCHCTQCQRRSGVPLTVNTYFKKDDVKLAGDFRIFERPAPEGRKVYNYFCPTCGTTLGWRGDVRPDVIGVAAGCFADKSLPTPSVSIWEETMHPWIKLPEGMQHFPQAR
jgi:hypothetical protein